MKSLESLTIFFPAFNDAKSLPLLIFRAYQAGKSVTKNLEVLVIDDGSTDETWRVLLLLKNQFPGLKLIHHPKNQGYGAALRTGFTNSSKKYVFYTDGDGQYDPLELLSLVAHMRSDIDVVNGYKLNRSDNLLRKIVGKLYNCASHLEYQLPIRDVQCDFRLIRKSVLDRIKLRSSSGLICLELVVKLTKAGARFTEVGVRHNPREYGHSQFFHLNNLIRTGKEHLLMYIKHH